MDDEEDKEEDLSYTRPLQNAVDGDLGCLVHRRCFCSCARLDTERVDL